MNLTGPHGHSEVAVAVSARASALAWVRAGPTMDFLRSTCERCLESSTALDNPAEVRARRAQHHWRRLGLWTLRMVHTALDRAGAAPGGDEHGPRHIDAIEPRHVHPGGQEGSRPQARCVHHLTKRYLHQELEKLPSLAGHAGHLREQSGATVHRMEQIRPAEGVAAGEGP